MKKGFTLVEVLAVIVIVGILFLVSLPTLLNSIKNSQDKIDSNIYDLVKNALEEYREDNFNALEDNYCVDISTLISDGYIDEDIVTSKDNKLLNKAIRRYIDDNNKEVFEFVNECQTTG